MFEYRKTTSCGYPFHHGDIVDSSEGRLGIVSIDKEEERIQAYDFEREESEWYNKHEFHQQWEQIRNGKNVRIWIAFGRGYRDVLTPDGPERHFVQGHEVFIPYPAKDHVTHSYCLSWSTLTDEETIPHPSEMEFLKYSDAGELSMALSQYLNGDALIGSDLDEWVSTHEQIDDLLKQVCTDMNDRWVELQEENRAVQENEDRIKERMEDAGIIPLDGR